MNDGHRSNYGPLSDKVQCCMLCTSQMFSAPFLLMHTWSILPSCLRIQVGGQEQGKTQAWTSLMVSMKKQSFVCSRISQLVPGDTEFEVQKRHLAVFLAYFVVNIQRVHNRDVHQVKKDPQVKAKLALTVKLVVNLHLVKKIYPLKHCSF